MTDIDSKQSGTELGVPRTAWHDVRRIYAGSRLYIELMHTVDDAFGALSSYMVGGPRRGHYATATPSAIYDESTTSIRQALL